MTDRDRVWILGASDPEMERVAGLLGRTGQRVTRALHNGRPVTPATAYQADPPPVPRGARVVWVECLSPHRPVGERDVVVDHHHPGDPGYGAPPHLYWEASSLGQVWAILAEDGLVHGEPGLELRLAAAADHCPSHAYRGLCPGIDPDELMRWRIRVRSQFQRVAEAELAARVEAARAVIAYAPRRVIGGESVAVVDGHVPELPEASMRMGVAVLYRLPATGERGAPAGAGAKEGILGDLSGRAVEAAMREWATAPDTIGQPWGDPARGFCGRWVSD